MRTFRGVALFLLIPLLEGGVATSVHAAAATSRTDQLSSRDRQAIVSILCAPVGSAGIEVVAATRTGRASSRSPLAIRCQAHGIEANVPLVRVARCSREKGSWKCMDARDALLMKLPNDSPLALVAEAVPAREAMKAVFEAASLTVPPFHTAAAAILQEQCTLRQGGDKAFKGAAHFDVDCTRGRLSITRDCWNSRCRFFVTGGSQRE